ncbi:chromatin remodelling complex ATPase chain ISW1 [Histoplasma capsulatum]|uniref:Chromatin remodelling complex ATPase chain ISW1 n=1 Tax=Ajellomyces capsulatus TaxID=5037 RepID=A0A8A1MEG1_AJECA|nr:chromatin remodelling complex ATPase chain ISW1 [Histoplasma capsulatum]
MAPSLSHPSRSESPSKVDIPMADANGHTSKTMEGARDEDHSMMDYQDTPDYTYSDGKSNLCQDSDTNPNTTASSIAGDTVQQDGRKRRSEAFQLRKSVLGRKHGRLDESKEDDSIRRFRYLLGLTDLFRHFIETNPNPRIKEIMAEIDRQNEMEAGARKGLTRKGGASGERRRRTEQEEDAELLKDEKRGGQAETVFRESPAFVKGGEMRDYQSRFTRMAFLEFSPTRWVSGRHYRQSHFWAI